MVGGWGAAGGVCWQAGWGLAGTGICQGVRSPSSVQPGWQGGGVTQAAAFRDSSLLSVPSLFNPNRFDGIARGPG